MTPTLSPSPARAVSLIGAPTDVGAGARGASMGPEALRVAGLQPALESHGLTVVDRGNLNGPANPWQPPESGYRHLAEVVAWNQHVFDAVSAELKLGHLPILMGGDHCLGLGSISAVARHCLDVGKTLRVLWLDAHADFNTSALTPSGNVHGMPVACLCGFGPVELTQLAGMPGGAPRCGPTRSARSASAAWTRARSVLCTSRAWRSLTCATSTKWACAPPCSRPWRVWTRTLICT